MSSKLIGCVSSYSDDDLTITVEANGKEIDLEFPRDVVEGVDIKFGAPVVLFLRDGAPVIQRRELRPVQETFGDQAIDRWIKTLS